jgi:hypothetical protein
LSCLRRIPNFGMLWSAFPGCPRSLRDLVVLGKDKIDYAGRVKGLRINYERMRKHMIPGFKELKATLVVFCEERCR